MAERCLANKDRFTLQLEVGRYYQLEDPLEGDPLFLKYLGNGGLPLSSRKLAKGPLTTREERHDKTEDNSATPTTFPKMTQSGGKA